MKTKTARRALFMSIVSLFVCVSMFVGTTFAWFTDSASSGRNTIVAGNLDVVLEYWDGDSYEEVTSATKLFDDAAKWEPGYTEIAYLKVSNAGSLALKYQLAVNVYGETLGKTKAGADIKLSDHLVFKVVTSDADLADTYDRETAKTAAGTVKGLNAYISAGTPLENTGDADYVALIIYMPESVGNEANHDGTNIPKIEMGVNLLATQYTYEEDSFDNQYDKMATVDDIDELNAALAADYDLISLGADIALTESITIPAGKTVAIDLAGNTLSQVKGDINTTHALIWNKGTLTIEDSIGTGKISFADTTPYTADVGWASNTIRNEGTLTINGGTVENITAAEVMSFSYPHAIDCFPGSVTTVNGGTVKSLNYDSIRMFCNSTTAATTVNINGGTIVNRISFQNPDNNRHSAGYGVLNIAGGVFTTTGNVTANVRLLNFSRDFSNMKATVTGGTFDKGFKTQDLASCGVVTSDWLTYAGATAVASDVASLQKAIDEAEDGAVIKLVADITGDVTVTQKADVKITIDGNGKTYAGVITVDGKSQRYPGAGLTIENVNFAVDTLSADAFIRLGHVDAARYTNNVTVKDCTFSSTGETIVAVKSYTGGDYNLTIDGCTVNAGMHSLAQLKNIEMGLKVVDCKVYSKNGLNTNNSYSLDMSGCTFDVKGYAVRFGSDAAVYDRNFTITNSTLKSACAEAGDAVIEFRKGGATCNLTLTNTTLDGTTLYAGNTANTNIVIN